jgi:UrcA family protein
MLSLHQILVRVITLLVMPALIFAESAMAAERVDEAPPSVTVRYHDLNLNSPEGVASLYRRIHAAAVNVCESAEGPQLVNKIFWNEWNFCMNHAVANAVQAVHNEKLSAYHWNQIRGRKAATPITVVTR